MPLRLVVTVFLMTSTSSKRIPLSLGKRKNYVYQDQVNRELVPARWFSFRSRTAVWSSHQVPLLYKHTQIFGDNLPNTVLFHVRLTCDHSNSQPTITTHHVPHLLHVDLSPACWRPPAPGVIFHLFALCFELLVPLKNTWAWHGVISIYLLKYFKWLWRSFPNAGLQFSDFFLHQCS